MISTTRLAHVFIFLILVPVLTHALFGITPGLASFVVTSDSMSPEIDAGSVVYVADTGSYRTGDVITFERDSMLITHRIVAETPDGYRTKGDANDQADARPVTPDQIHGEVVFAVPLYGYLLSFASGRLGIVLFVLLPGGGILLLTIRDLIGQSTTE